MLDDTSYANSVEICVERLNFDNMRTIVARHDSRPQLELFAPHEDLVLSSNCSFCRQSRPSTGAVDGR